VFTIKPESVFTITGIRSLLQSRDPLSGIRDFEAVEQLAVQSGFKLLSDTAMPANNQLLIFKRQ